MVTPYITQEQFDRVFPDVVAPSTNSDECGEVWGYATDDGDCISATEKWVASLGDEKIENFADYNIPLFAHQQAATNAAEEQKRRADCFDDLLASLLNILNAVGQKDPQPWHDARQDAAAAIAKATGVEQCPAFLEQFKADPTGKWPKWFKDLAAEKSASFPKSNAKANLAAPSTSITDKQVAVAIDTWFSKEFEYNSSMETRMRAAIEAVLKG